MPRGPGKRNHGLIEECPGRMRPLPGLTQGSRRSHGTWASYDRQGRLGQWGAAGVAEPFAERVRAEVPGAAVQPRFCREPEYLGEVRRWQAAKRQRKCRSQPGACQRHAEAERQRRKQRAAGAQQSSEGTPAVTESERASSADFGVWSRSRRHPKIFFDRPGCYDPPRDSPRAPASYCGDDCRAAMRHPRRQLSHERQAHRVTLAPPRLRAWSLTPWVSLAQHQTVWETQPALRYLRSC